jgi:tetraacyldisaccharide 4'-kinase
VRVDARLGGDEPVQIARKFRACCVVVGERRVEAAHVAVEQLQCELLVLDDGFQHRSLKRDLDIVVADSRTDVFSERFLPAGNKREPVQALNRAHMVALSHFPEGGSRTPTFGGKPIVKYRYTIVRFLDVKNGSSVDVSGLRKRPLMLFSGIGHHPGFLDDMRRYGLNVVGDRWFGDHHWFTRSDAATLINDAREAKAMAFVTTEKDAIRLLACRECHDELLGFGPVSFPVIGLDIIDGADLLEKALRETTAELQHTTSY